MKMLKLVLPSLLLLSGCSKQENSKMAENTNFEFTESELRLVGKSDETTVVAGTQFTVEGSFKIANQPEPLPSVITVKIIAPGIGKDGKDGIMYEKSVTPEIVGNRISFRGDVRAPNRPGNYNISAWLKKQNAAQSKINVSGDQEK